MTYETPTLMAKAVLALGVYSKKRLRNRRRSLSVRQPIGFVGWLFPLLVETMVFMSNTAQTISEQTVSGSCKRVLPYNSHTVLLFRVPFCLPVEIVLTCQV